jgi:hypothetical protein
VRASPDGYTLLLVSTTGAINATFYDKLNFNLIRDIAPVAGLMRVSYYPPRMPCCATRWSCRRTFAAERAAQ